MKMGVEVIYTSHGLTDDRRSFLAFEESPDSIWRRRG